MAKDEQTIDDVLHGHPHPYPALRHGPDIGQERFGFPALQAVHVGVVEGARLVLDVLGGKVLQETFRPHLLDPLPPQWLALFPEMANQLLSSRVVRLGHANTFSEVLNDNAYCSAEPRQTRG
jgi:hypothetical protein